MGSAEDMAKERHTDSDMQAVLLPITTQGSFAVGSIASGMVGVGVGEDKPANA